jgi:hypothetical protein
LDIHLILDNYGTHKNLMIRNWPGQAATLPPPLHADFRLVTQPGRTLVRGPHRQATAARHPSLHQGTRRRHRKLHPTPQPRSKTLRLAQNSRPNPRLNRTVLFKNFKLTTLRREKTIRSMNITANFEHRAGSSLSKHEGERQAQPDSR